MTTLPPDMALAVAQLDSLMAHADRLKTYAEQAKADILASFDPTTVITAAELVPGDVILAAGRWSPVVGTGVGPDGIDVTFTVPGSHGGDYPVFACWNPGDPVRVQTPRPTLEWWHAAEAADLVQHAIEAVAR